MKIKMIFFIILFTPLCVFAEYTDEESSSDEDFYFDGNMAFGGGKDLSSFSQKNVLQPGVYPVTVIVNNDYDKTDLTLTFSKETKNNNVTACFTKSNLEKIGFNIKALNINSQEKIESGCHKISELVSEYDEQYDFSTGDLLLTLPQVFKINSFEKEIMDEDIENGLNGVSLNYSYFYSSTNPFTSKQPKYESLSILNRTNIHTSYGITLHNSAYYTKNNDIKSQRTYAEYDFIPFKTNIIIGEVYTNNDYFDSISIKGLALNSNRAMWSKADKRNLPAITGIANSNAVIKVYQGDNLIYQEKVSPGPFSITNYVPYGSGGNLDVYVEESNGERRKIIVPFSMAFNMIKKGKFTYSLESGKYDNDDYNKTNKPLVTLAGVTYGLTEHMNIFSGYLFTNNYSSGSFGFGLNTRLGSFKADMAYAEVTPYSEKKKYSGYSNRLSYSNRISQTNTNVSLSLLRYYSKDFWSLDDSVKKNKFNIEKPKYQAGLYIHQPIMNYGTLGLSITNNEYWSKNRNNNSFTNITWNSSLKNLNYNVSYGFSNNENQFGISFTLPLSDNRTYLRSDYFKSNRYGDSKYLSLDSSLEENQDIQYGLSLSQSQSESPGYSFRGTYTGKYGYVNAEYEKQNYSSTLILNGSGSVVAYKDDLILSQQVGNTVGIVEAKDAGGSIINGYTNNRLNNNGRGIVNLSPYNINSVSISPEDTSLGVSLESSIEQTIPRNGALIPVKFRTNFNKASRMLHISNTLLSKISTGSKFYSNSGLEIGVFTQGKRIMVAEAHVGDVIYFNDINHNRCIFTIKNSELEEFGLPVSKVEKCE